MMSLASSGTADIILDSGASTSALPLSYIDVGFRAPMLEEKGTKRPMEEPKGVKIFVFPRVPGVFFFFIISTEQKLIS